jgi:hypothetical protein
VPIARVLSLSSAVLLAVGCAHDAGRRASEPGMVAVTPALTSHAEARMLVGRWDGQQSGTWGYGRHPYRTFIIDRLGPGEGPTWQADARWGYTDQCCVRVSVQVERERSYLLLSFVGPVGERYSFSTSDGKLMQGTMRYDYDNRQALVLTRILPTARALSPARPIPSVDALVGVWRGWVRLPGGGDKHLAQVTVKPDGSYSGSERIGRGSITLSGTSHADVRAAGGAGGSLTLHHDEGTEILRFVFTGGTVADFAREQ